MPGGRSGIALSATFALLLALSGQPGSAETWTGGSGTSDWFTAGNWEDGAVPSVSSAAAVVIDNGGSVAIDGSAADGGWLELGTDSTGNSLTISNGGSLTVYDNSYIGQNVGSSGTLTITGSDSSWIQGDIYSYLYIGYEGSGTVVVSDGALLDSSIRVAESLGSTGSVTITGSDTTLDGSLYMGDGNATATISDGATVTFTIESEGAGTSDVLITGAGTRVEGAIKQAAGTLTISDGASVSTTSTINIRGRNFLNSLSGVSGESGDAVATITGEGTTVEAGTLSVSASSDTSLTISDGAVVTVTSGTSFSGSAYLSYGPGYEQPETEATIVITGEGTTLNTLDLNLGQGGTTTLTVSDGAEINVGASTRFARLSDSLTTVNIGAAEGEEAAAAGYLNLQGTMGFYSGTGELVFNYTEEDYDFAADITSGTGDATIRQIAGVTTLSGDSSAYLETTEVTGGALYVTGALGGTFDVSGGILGGTGTIGTAAVTGEADEDSTAASVVTVASGGTLAPGLSGEIGTLIVAGDLTFASGSTLEAQVASDETSDLVSVGGDVTIESGAQLAVYALGEQADYGTDYSEGVTYAVVSADGALSGDFTLSTTETAFLTYATETDEQNAYVTVALKGEEPTEAPTEGFGELPSAFL